MILRSCSRPIETARSGASALLRQNKFLKRDSSSAKLFADAEAEEQAETEAQASRSKANKAPVQEYENWCVFQQSHL